MELSVVKGMGNSRTAEPIQALINVKVYVKRLFTRDVIRSGISATNTASWPGASENIPEQFIVLFFAHFLHNGSYVA